MDMHSMKGQMKLTCVIWTTFLLAPAASYSSTASEMGLLDGKQPTYLISKSLASKDMYSNESVASRKWKGFSLASITNTNDNLETNLVQAKGEHIHNLPKFSQNHDHWCRPCHLAFHKCTHSSTCRIHPMFPTSRRNQLPGPSDSN